MLEQLIANVTSQGRRTIHEGREYFVAPLSMIVPGVLNGSKGPLYYPLEEIGKDPDAWNGMPIVVYHPTNNEGKPVSARSPQVLEKHGIGWVFNAQVNDKLVAEGWFDVEKTKKVDPRILSSLEKGDPLELSTGLFTENEPVKNKEEAIYNGRPYTAIARNYKPDHLAVLPDKKGACSIADGCGVNVNEEDSDLEEYGLDWDDPDSHSPHPQTVENEERHWWELVVNQDGKESWWKLLTDNEMANVSPAKACEILKDGTVNGKKLTGKQRRMFGALCGQTRNSKENDMKLKADEKTRIIDALIANEGIEGDGPWVEEDREALEAMPESKLVALNAQREALVNAMVEEDEEEDEMPPASPMKKKSVLKKMTKNGGDCGCPDLATNQTKQLTEKEWLDAAPPKIRSVVANAIRFEQSKKQELIDQIIANERNPFSDEYLQARSLDELQGLAALASAEKKTRSGVLNDYAAGAGQTSTVPALNEDFYTEDQDLIPEPFDWGFSNDD